MDERMDVRMCVRHEKSPGNISEPRSVIFGRLMHVEKISLHINFSQIANGLDLHFLDKYLENYCFAITLHKG